MNPICVAKTSAMVTSTEVTSGVSVIVTVNTRLDFLAQALKSALAQTLPVREIIVADSSGTGAARQICELFVAAGQIVYRARPETLDVVANLRSAISEAQGEFIAFLHDDDLWEPDFLCQLVPPLQSDSARVLAFSDHWIISRNGSVDHKETDANTRRYGRANLPSGELRNPAEFVLGRNGVPLAMASVFRKDALDLASLTHPVSGACDFWIACLLAASGGKFFYVPRRLTKYRVHADSETARRYPERFDSHVFIFSQILQRKWFPELGALLRRALSGAFFRSGRNKLYFNQVAAARRCLLQSIKRQPGWRASVALVASFLPRSIRARLGLSEPLMKTEHVPPDSVSDKFVCLFRKVFAHKHALVRQH